MKIKTAEATELQLDFLVAKAGSVKVSWDEIEHAYMCPDLEEIKWHRYSPSTDPAQGYPIIERKMIRLIPWDRAKGQSMHGQWFAGIYGVDTGQNGPTPLIAAMRCFVASELGDEVEIPEELK